MDFTFTVTEEEINLLGYSLGELPFKTVSSLVLKLNQQLSDQNKLKNQEI